MDRIIHLIFIRERKYYKKNWRIFCALFFALTFLLTLLVFLPLNDINNFNNSIPYHIQVDSISSEMINEIKDIDNVEEVGIRSSIFTDGNIRENVEYYDEAAMKFNSIRLTQGRYPTEVNEVISTNKNNRLGDRVKIGWTDLHGNRLEDEFEIVGIAKNNLAAAMNNMFIVSALFASENDGGKEEIYLLLNDTSLDRLDRVQSELVRMGVVDKDIHINTYFLNGIFGNRVQVLILIIFGCAVALLLKSIISAVYTIFIEGDQPYFYKMKVLGVDYVQFRKLIHKRFFYLMRIVVLTLALQFVVTYAIYRILDIEFSLALFTGVCFYVFCTLAVVLELILKKQIRGMKNEAQNSQKYGYELPKLSVKQRISHIDAKTLAKRHGLIYRKRYGAILRNMTVVMIFFIIVSTVFTSINFEDRLKQIFNYNEDFIIYPEMRDQYTEMDGFQSHSPFSMEFINDLKELNGVKNIIRDEEIHAIIENDKGEGYEEIFAVLNNEKKQAISNDLIEGNIDDSGIILNGDKLLKEGVSGEIGDVLTLIDQSGHKVRVPIVARVNDHNSRQEIYIADDVLLQFEDGKNYIYSISILMSDGYEHGELKKDLKMLLSNYPSLSLRDYDEQFNELRDAFTGIYLSLGGVLIIVLLISIASFVSMQRVNLIQRKREFALLQINGMSRLDILENVLRESAVYIRKILLAVPVLSLVFSYFFVIVLKEYAHLSFLQYRYCLEGMIGVVMMLSLVILLTSFQEICKQNKESILNRVHF